MPIQASPCASDSSVFHLHGLGISMGIKGEKKSLSELQADAQKGDREAQNSLAMLHELGLIPDASSNEAMHWYGKAVKGGDPAAALSLARLQEAEAGNPKVVQALYLLAAKQGFRSPKTRVEETFLSDKRATVLVVDDQVNFRTATTQILEKAGFKVLAAEDAYKALQFIEKRPEIRLVLSDLEMPDMNGVELLQLIRKRHLKTDLPVIMLTSSRDVELVKKAKALGLQGWILKPYQADMLLLTVEKIFKVKKAS